MKALWRDPRARRVRLPAAAVAAVLVAEAGVWLLRPERPIEPRPVNEADYFTPAQLQQARDYSSDLRRLAILGLACEGAVLVLLVWRPPRRLVERTGRAVRGRPLVTGALVGAGLAAAVQAAGLPAAALAHDRAVDVGLSTQDWGGWAADVAKSAAIGTVFAAGGAAVFLALMRRLPRMWWLAGTGVVVAVSVVVVWLGPVLLDPLYNKYDKLPPGRARNDVIALAHRAGIDVGEVYVVDASRRTRGANAYVTGLGHTKRVVLYDTLLERFTPAQTRLVVAHELGHVKHHDLRRGLLWILIAAPAGMYVVALLTERWGRRAGSGPGSPATVPALALALAVVTFGGTVISNQLSRRVEAAADQFALEATGEPRQFTGLERRLAITNVSDPDPPAALHWLFGTHPTTVERIGAALAFERQRGGPGPPRP
jgi:Zn-dependent protease with chaperone function